MKLKAIGLILFAYVLSVSASFAAIPPPLVNLDASGLTAGGNFTNWPNTGTLGGAFNVKLGTTPSTVTTVGGKLAVSFDGNNGLQSNTTTTLMTGKAPFTVAAWVYNPAIAATKVVFQWGKRNSNNRSAHLNYGSHGSSGAVGGYGENGDMTFTGGLPAANAWHHIAVTYDTMMERLYVDGVLHIAEGKVQDVAYTPFAVGRTVETGVVGLSGSIASVKMYNAALSEADLISLYTSEGGTAPPADPAVPTVLNPSFELPVISTLDQTISGGTYILQNWWCSSDSGAGITKKGTTSTTWYGSTMTTTTAGNQICLMANDDTRREIKQLVKGFKARKAYTVSVLASARAGTAYTPPPVMIDINGQGLMNPIQNAVLATGGTPWSSLTSNAWVCPADGAYWVSIHTVQGRLNIGGDKSSSLLIDNVQVNEVPAPAAETMIANPVGGQSWGVVTSAASSSSKNIVVTNTGTAAVNVTAVSLDGSSKFTLGTVATGSIAAAGTLTIPVTFNPASAAVGVYTAKVIVTTNDAVNPSKAYSVTAAVQASAAGKRTILIDDTGVSLGYNDVTGFGQFGGTTALRDANLALNVLTTTATTDMMIVDGNGVADTYAADFTVRQPAVTIRQVGNSQNSDSTITLASDGSQADGIIKICENNCAIQGLSANRKMVLICRFPVKGLMIGTNEAAQFNATYTQGLVAKNFVLSDFKFRGYGEASQTYSPNGVFNRVDWELISGESPRVSNANTTLYPLAQTTYNNCTAIHTATNLARYFLPVESANTSVTWNNSTIAHQNAAGERGTVWYGNGGSVVPNQTYTFNNCTFDWRGTQQQLISGWTTPGATVIFNNPTFLGPMSDLQGGGFINLTEIPTAPALHKYMTVKITGTPTNKVDLRGIRIGVNSVRPLIRHIGSTFILTDCIIDDKIDINSGRANYPSWNASTTLDRCYVMSEIGFNVNRKIKHTVTATNSIFQTSAATTTSLFLASSDSTSTANINHCTFVSDSGAVATAPFIWNDTNTPVTINNSLVNSPKPLNNLGIIAGAKNVLAGGVTVNGTNSLAGTLATGPDVDATGHLVPGTLNLQRTGVAPTVNIDYDGDPRPLAKKDPLIGADEANLVPVELSTFKAE